MKFWPVFNRPSKQSRNQEKFQHMLEFSRQIAQTNPPALVDLVRLYLRPLQTELLLSCAEREMHGARREIEIARFFMPTGPSSLRDYWNYRKCDPQDFRVDLAKDPVLPCPWHRDRYVDALAHIGRHKKSGQWQQDANHRVVVLLPWGIAFVIGGNHSIASGILSAEGLIQPVDVYEMSALLDEVECDGKNYLYSATRKPICAVEDYRIAALFEVGRLMRIHDVRPMSAVA